MSEDKERSSKRSNGKGAGSARSFDDSVLGPSGQIGPFRIEQELGRGAAGVVYLAHDTKLDRPVAIKSIPAALTENTKARSRFAREARVLASLNHPNIATIYDELQEAEGVGYLVLEYVPGQTLAERIAGKRLKSQEALSIAQQIAEAVAAAHEHNVVHCDLKPGNIKITPEGRIKVLDFGLAKALGGEAVDQQSTVTDPGRIIGTPSYMSPEQARGLETDKRCDIWSFGCVLYEMLTGKVPFEGETVSDTLAGILDREPDWHALPQATPANIRILLRRCLEKDPHRRLHDIADAAIEISETLSGTLEAFALPGKVAPVSGVSRFSRLFRRDAKPKVKRKPKESIRATETTQGEHDARRDYVPFTRRNYVPLMSDQPAERDMLKRQLLADALTGKLNDLGKDPATDSFMLLLDGPWGAGKTTILGFIRRVLQSPQGKADKAETRDAVQSNKRTRIPWIIIPFDAWRQSHVGPAWWGLLSSLRSSLSRELGWARRLLFRLRETWHLTAPDFGLAWILPFLAAAWLLAVVLMDHEIKLSAKDVGELAKSVVSVLSLLGLAWTAGVAVLRHLAWGSPRGAKLFEDTRADPMGDLAGHFHWLLLKSPGPVLFTVDDLDRCGQQYVVSFLDAVQTLIRNPHEEKSKRKKLFFVVAADGRWIRRSYEIAHAQYVQTVDEPGRSLGYLFLDKLFQVTVAVPALGEQLRAAYLNKLLGKKVTLRTKDETEIEEIIPQNNPDQQKVLKNLEQSIKQSESQVEILNILRKNRNHREALAVAALKRLNTPSLTETTKHVLEPYAALLDPNPRSIKRFLMTYNFTRDVRLLEGFSPTEDSLARWTILQLRWPELADYLRNHPNAIHKDEADRLEMPKKLAQLMESIDVTRVVEPLGAEGIRESAGYADFTAPEKETPDEPPKES